LKRSRRNTVGSRTGYFKILVETGEEHGDFRPVAGEEPELEGEIDISKAARR
jgi:hypothetical protein